MAEEDPSCPRCTGPVRPDWDWCQNCGYDPEGLKPAGWIPAPLPDPEPAPAGRRRSRRAKGAERARRNSSPAAARSAILVLPAQVVDLTRIAEPTRVIEPKIAPRPPARPRGPKTRPAGAPKPADVRMTTPARPDVAAGSTTFIQPSSRLELAIAGVLAATAALMAFVGLSSVGALSAGTSLNTIATGVFILVCLALAVGLAGQAYALVKVRVAISPTHLVANNRLGLPRRAELTEIFSVTLTTRHSDIGFGRTHDASVPYVQVTDGAGFWIDALGGRGGGPPTREQLAVLEQLARIVATHRPVPPPIDLPS